MNTRWGCRRCELYSLLDEHVRLQDISSIICDYGAGISIERKSFDFDMTFGHVNIELKAIYGYIIIQLRDGKTTNTCIWSIVYSGTYIYSNMFRPDAWRFGVANGWVSKCGSNDNRLGGRLKQRFTVIVKTIYQLLLAEETGAHFRG